MNNKKYNQIIKEVYGKYLDYLNEHQIYGVWYDDEKSFEKECKADKKFAEIWGLKIEERELTTVKERKKYDRFFDDLIGEYPEHHKTLDNRGVPRKIITVTYNNEKIEVYE